MLNRRLLTAAIGLAVLFLGIWYLPPLYFAIAITLIILFSAWEWSALIGFKDRWPRIVYVFIVLMAVYYVRFVPAFPIFLISFLFWLWVAAAIYCFNVGRKPLGFQRPEVQSVFGLVVLVSCWLAIVFLRDFGPIRLFVGLLLVFAADTGGYIAGRVWGKRPFMQRVSPKKTVEGFWGGLFLSLIVGFIAAIFSSPTWLQILFFMLLVLAVALFSVVGDLSISLLKRQSGLKDTGNILPGHGGILDRLDSVAAGILVFAFGLLLLGG